MANSDKNILITPNKNAAGIPEIALTGFGASTISMRIPDTNVGTLEFVNSGVTLFSINANTSDNKQLSIGSSTTGSLMDLNQNGDISLKTQKNIIFGKGIILPKIKPSQSSSVKGKIAYDTVLKTLVVNNSKTWITYGLEQEKYIQDGLILYYDPSRPDSYPGSGSVVYDISGSGLSYTGSMNNVGFSTFRGGAFTFNGSNSYIDVSNSADILRDYSGYTVEWYVKITTATNGEIFGNYGPSYTTNALWISARYGHWLTTANPYFAANSFTGNEFSHPLPPTYIYHAAATRQLDSNNRDVVLYLNGVVNNTSTANIQITNNINYRIGLDVNSSTSEPFGGDLYAIRVYNRALTPKEIQMNFNATRNRVGL